MPTSGLSKLMQQQALPTDFMCTVDKVYRPIAAQLARWQSAADRTIVIGVNGCQGSGKSTLAVFLKHMLGAESGIRAEVVSMDNLYHPRDKREELGDSIHPLLRTRGVPGTHDIQLGGDVIRQLCGAGKATATAIPGFDKATDDCTRKEIWDVVTGRPDIVILEGWCVGVTAQEETEIVEAINSLESEKDPDCVWRRYVNEQIAGPYAHFFECVDFLVMLQAPSFDVVFDWRRQQERQLGERTGKRSEPAGIMGDEALNEFIMHFERLTRHMLRTLPAKTDILVELVADRSPGRVVIDRISPDLSE